MDGYIYLFAFDDNRKLNLRTFENETAFCKNKLFDQRLPSLNRLFHDARLIFQVCIKFVHFQAKKTKYFITKTFSSASEQRC